MHDEIVCAYNSFLQAYRKYVVSGNMNQYNADLDEIFDRYKSNGDMLNFCKGLLAVWTPVVNRTKEEK